MDCFDGGEKHRKHYIIDGIPDPGSPLKWGKTKITRNIQDKEYKNEVLHFCKKMNFVGCFCG